MQWILDHIVNPVLNWILHAITWGIVEAVKLISEGLLAVLNAIPICGCFSQAAGFFTLIPPQIAFFARSFHFLDGLQIMLCCLMLRFVIRRIPIIG